MITITDTDLEVALKSLLQRNVTLVIGRKKWKTGKIILFKQNGFFVKFIIKKDGKTERFEIPVPFDVKRDKNRILLSYQLKYLARCKKDALEKMKTMVQDCKSKYCDSVLEITIHETAD